MPDETTITGENPVPNEPKQAKHFSFKDFFGRIKAWIKAHPRKAIAIGIAVALVLAGGVFVAIKYWPKKPIALPVVTKKKVPPKPTTKPSPLTGLDIAPALADRTVRAVIIENHTDARPQSGLSSAGVVYEALAEGGITRYEAFFGDEMPATLGPVRSLRTYFLSWGLEFDAPVAHAGGNADALDEVGPLGMKDMNEFTNGSYFYRSTDRYAPHNLYTSTDSLDKLIAARGYTKVPSFKVSPRKKDTPPAKGVNPAHPTISIRFSYAAYDAKFQYDPATNTYLRFVGGKPDIDRNTGAQISVKNIIVETMPTSYGTTRIGEQTVIMQTVGSGSALVFRDGDVAPGTWSKASNADRTRLVDATGKDIPLNKGHSWYAIVPPTGSVGY